MENKEIFDTFVAVLRDNYAERHNLGGLPINVNNSLNTLNQKIIKWLYANRDCQGVEEIRKIVSSHFNGIMKEISNRMYVDLNNDPISPEQVYNYIVTLVEKIGDFLGYSIPDDLFWDGDDDEETEISEPAAEITELSEPTTTKKTTQIELLTEINNKLGILINILSKTANIDLGAK